MMFSISRAPLFEALQKIQSVVEKKNTIQILGNILCSVSQKTLSLSATDLEVGIKIVLPIDNGTDGKVTISAKHFFDIVKELPDKPIKVSKKENNWIELTCGKSKFTIVSLSADEFPALPQFEEKEYFDSRTSALIEMIDKTHFAVSTDATRYHLNGVFFEHLDNGIMRMAATDGHRLSYVDQEVFKKLPELKRGIIVPKKGLMELRKIIPQGEDTIGLAFERGYIFAKIQNTYLFIRLIDGEYPDYRPVIPKQAEKVVRLSKDDFNSALKRVSLLSHEKGRGVKFVIQSGMMTISSSNPDMGEAREEIEVEYSGEPLEVGFNSKYLLDCLAVTETNSLELLLKDRLSPGVLRAKEQANHLYVIMPMRI